MAARPSHGWWPYLGPYATFLVLVEIAGRVSPPLAPYLLVLRVAVPGLWLLALALRGTYPELRGYRPGALGLLMDVGCGVAIAALWMGAFQLFPGLPRPAEGGFDTRIFGAGREPLALAVRLIGFACVTPFMEELFVRSFLLRLVEVMNGDMNFRRVPIAQFGWRSFLVTVAWFTFTHVQWEWPVAFVTGVVWNLWLYRRRHIGSTIVAHAVANAAIWVAVVEGPPSLAIFL
jgi:CAAX protease family protein